MSQRCSTCHQAVRQILSAPKDDFSGEKDTSNACFGILDEISARSGTCQSCADIVAVIATRWLPTTHKEEPRGAIKVWAECSQWRSFRLTWEDNNSTQFNHNHCIEMESLQPSHPDSTCPRLFDAHEFDIQLIKSWAECCHTSHRDTCSSLAKRTLTEQTSELSILLVDVVDGCLVKGTLKDTYITLSYVWGHVTVFKTTTANLNDLLKPGSIKYDSQLPIPETVRDTMRLATQLNIRYVWVDSLCIVQDDITQQSQLEAMASIYAAAYFTLVAMGDNADAGLHGLGLGSKPLDRFCNVIRFPGVTFCQPNTGSYYPGRWANRAWTLQECLASPRMLLFDSNFQRVHWSCGREWWREDEKAPSERLSWAAEHAHQFDSSSRFFRLTAHGMLDIQWPDLRHWCHVVSLYAPRELTWDSDVLNALVGTIRYLEPHFPGGLHFGIPELFFDVCLLWDVHPLEPPTRRKYDGVPSWSFLGWKGGKLDLFWWNTSMDWTFLDDCDNNFGHDCEVRRIVDWRKVSEYSKMPHPLSAAYYKYTDSQGKLMSRELPGEWVKHTNIEGIDYFTHPNSGAEPFRYPIPFPESAFPDSTVYSKYLQFKAKRAWLKLGERILTPVDEYFKKTEQKSENTAVVSLVDQDNHWVGAMRLPYRLPDDSVDIPCEIDRHTCFELIAIATGKVLNSAFPKLRDWTPDGTPVYHHIPEWSCPRRPAGSIFYEFYFVLWIGWHENIAYRKGLGRVEKSAWDRLPLQEIDVVLG